MFIYIYTIVVVIITIVIIVILEYLINVFSTLNVIYNEYSSTEINATSFAFCSCRKNLLRDQCGIPTELVTQALEGGMFWFFQLVYGAGLFNKSYIIILWLRKVKESLIDC